MKHKWFENTPKYAGENDCSGGDKWHMWIIDIKGESAVCF